MVGSDMGTTCTAALLLGQALYIAHVGDSRAYLRDAGGLRVLTNDHSTVGRLIEMGQLEPSAARDHPLRNQLYRTIGQQREVQVDFVYQPLGNSTHLLLCSDGLWGMVADADLEEVLTTHLWPQDACNELIKRANLAGGEDNISAVVVTLPVVEGTRP
jgi:serine/threonine protein phosphatase PrpC